MTKQALSNLLNSIIYPVIERAVIVAGVFFILTRLIVYLGVLWIMEGK